MEYKEIEKVNSEMETTDIKGKGYVEVNQRIKAFRKIYPEGFIETEIVSNENGVVVMQAEVGYHKEIFLDDGKNFFRKVVLATGHAYEKEDSTFINKTSYIENCETSAVGRALGMLGLGIDTSVASAEEVQNAIVNQELTEEDAENWRFQFGKYKNETMNTVLELDEQYVRWYLNNKASEYDKKCYELLSGEKLPTDEEQDTRIKLISELNNLELKYNVAHEDILEAYKVNSINEMTVFQLTDAITKIRGKHND